MNRHPRRRLPLRTALAIAVSLLALPYLVDVAYLGDLTPTHSAQEIINDKDKDYDEQVLVVFTDYELDHVGIRASEYDLPLSFLAEDDVDRAVLPFEYLMTASLISRPPPFA
jgi:hypothetical protein